MAAIASILSLASDTRWTPSLLHRKSNSRMSYLMLYSWEHAFSLSTESLLC